MGFPNGAAATLGIRVFIEENAGVVEARAADGELAEGGPTTGQVVGDGEIGGEVGYVVGTP